LSTHSDVIAAVQSGDVEKLRGLLHDDPSLAAAKDANGVSALMFAFYYRRSEIADLLLAEKSDLDIFEATAAGRPDKVSEILQREPQIAKSWSPDGFTALHFAAFFNRPEIAGILIRNGADVSAASHNAMKVTPLHSAAAAHSGTVVRILVENGAPPNARQEGGWTALHEAAQIGDIKMVKTLLEHGAIHRQQATAGKRLRTWRRPKGTRRL
jgi:uncharacterized protein